MSKTSQGGMPFPISYEDIFGRASKGRKFQAWTPFLRHLFLMHNIWSECLVLLMFLTLVYIIVSLKMHLGPEIKKSLSRGEYLDATLSYICLS